MGVEGGRKGPSARVGSPSAGLGGVGPGGLSRVTC